MPAILILLLRELISAGALSGIIKSVLDSGAGSGVRERALDALRTIIQENVKRILLAMIAVFFLMVAAGFLIAGGFMWLLSVFTAAEAAGIVGGIFLLLGCVFLWICLRKKKKPALPEPQPVEEKPEGSPLGSFAESAKSIFGDFKEEVSDLLTSSKGKHSWVFWGLMLILGLGIGLLFKKDKD